MERLKKENEELKTVLKGMATVFGEEILTKAKEQMKKDQPKELVFGVPECAMTPYEALVYLGKKKGD